MRCALSPLSSRPCVAASTIKGLLGPVDAGGGGVLELLFGAEERIEDGLAGSLADGQGDSRTDDRDEQQATDAALALLGLAAQRLRGFLQALGGLAQVLLDLLVAGYGLDRPFAVAGRPAVGALGGLEGVFEALTQ